MTVLDENKYKKTYNIAECANITDTDVSNPKTALAAYTKAADWINSCSELNDIFTAEALTVEEGKKYKLVLRCSAGPGIGYGNIGSLYYSTQINYGDTSSSITNNVMFEDLRLMVIKSKYGFIAGLYDGTDNKRYRINMIYTNAIDDAGAKKGIALFLLNTYLYTSWGNNKNDYTDCLTFGDNSRNSYSEKTGLFTFMPPKTELMCSHVRECRGATVYDHVFFEADGKTWCCITTGEKNIPLALEIE